jgi:hypothetical protein
MDKLIEDEEILTIGKKTFDVSNTAIGRKKISRRIWDKMVKDYNAELESDKDDIEVHSKFRDIIESIYEKQGLYLIRQNFIVLKRRYGFLTACKEYLRRRFLSVRYLNSLSEKENEPFQAWAHLNITGVKKKDLEMLSEIQKLEIRLVEQLKKQNISLEQLMDALPIFLDGMAGNTNIFAPLQKM